MIDSDILIYLFNNINAKFIELFKLLPTTPTQRYLQLNIKPSKVHRRANNLHKRKQSQIQQKHAYPQIILLSADILTPILKKRLQ